MKKLAMLYTVAVLLTVLLAACSDTRTDIPAPIAVGVHPEGIAKPSSPDFHGNLFTSPDDLKKCQSCHAKDFSGGVTGSSCRKCHSAASLHVAGITDPSSANFHGKFVAAANWSMQDCKGCHGTEYKGGWTGKNCRTCHTLAAGPEACNTCHGSFSDSTAIAPPRGLGGTTSGGKVGAHTAHLVSGTTSIAGAVACAVCHTVPSTFAAAGHIDGTAGAELVFTALALTKTNNAGGFNYTSSLPTYTPAPTYNTSAGTCANTYCHGQFKNGNQNRSVSWNGGSSESKCYSCHGNTAAKNPLPGGNHPQVQNCTFCHNDVVSITVAGTDTTYNIINKSKHLNGKLNVYGAEQATW